MRCEQDRAGGINDDCSKTLGPFLGYPPRCAPGQLCEDYDYSRSPTDSFPLHPTGSIMGAQVEHCNAVDVGLPVAKAMLAATTLPPLPFQVPVTAP